MTLTKREQRVFEKCDQLGKHHEDLELTALDRGDKRGAREHKSKANMIWEIQRELYKDES